MSIFDPPDTIPSALSGLAAISAYDQIVRGRGLASAILAAPPQRHSNVSALEGYSPPAAPLSTAAHGMSVLAAALAACRYHDYSDSSLTGILSAPPRRRAFLSFKIQDHWAVGYLRAVAANPSYDLEFYDESVRVPFNSIDAGYIRSRLRDKIGRTSVTICIVGERTRFSDWVDFELLESLMKGNKIIAMGMPPGWTTGRAPGLIESLRLPVIPWDLDRLQRQIETAPVPIPIPAP